MAHLIKKLIETPFVEDYYGIDAVAMFRSLAEYPNITNLIADIVSLTYNTFLGTSGRSFLMHYLSVIDTIKTTENIESIKNKVLILRNEFSTKGLFSYYTNDYREYNLLCSLSLFDSKYIRGRLIDVGADDNRMAHVLINHFSDIDYVLGIDIRDCTNHIKHSGIKFKIQPNGCVIPEKKNSFDVAICRYSLHHMSIYEQLCILAEISRVLTNNGVLIVYENSFSLYMQPLVLDHQHLSSSLHDRLKELNSHDIRLLMSILDIFSLGIKNKNQHFPFTFRSVEEWASMFAVNFTVESIQYYGLPILDLHQQPLAVFILRNKKEATRLG